MGSQAADLPTSVTGSIAPDNLPTAIRKVGFQYDDSQHGPPGKDLCAGGHGHRTMNLLPDRCTREATEHITTI
jgi:hypothetical protein